MTSYTATYSPDDNKLRLYASSRLDAETYARVKAAGFAWAPKQELFVAPMWTPAREDLALELAGEIGDEDKSLTERAEERAERFDDYSAKRAADANRAHEAVADIAERFEFGQPILVGHHSERKARKDAERMESGMRRAVNAFETSQYWVGRAAGAIRAAKYKEKPEVRARRIKTIEADKRKAERNIAEAQKHLDLYARPEGLTPSEKYPHGILFAYLCAWGGGLSYEAARALEKAPETLPEVLASATKGQHAYIAHLQRWIAHYDNRLAYERAMLGEAGRLDLLEKPKRPAPLPLLNYRAPGGSVRCANMYHRGEFIDYPQIEMTAAEYAKIHADYKGTRNPHGTTPHRIRTCMQPATRGHGLVCVFITDSKAHPAPEAAAPAAPAEPSPALLASMDREALRRSEHLRTIPQPDPEAEKFAQMKQALKSGVQVVSAPQLFPTPVDLAARMVDEADIQPGMRVLEPSAGTGRLLDAIAGAEPAAEVAAVEVNAALCRNLRAAGHGVLCRDFLQVTPAEIGYFDRIVMNPPFGGAQDIAHIRHALQFLKPAGRLVALCAAGSRQRAAFEHLGYWEDLPAGSFASEGTGVDVALLVLTADALAHV